MAREQERVEGASARVLAAALAILACCGGAASSAAASFELDGGVALEGAIAAAGRSFVTIETEAGLRVVARDAIRSVRIEPSDGAPIAGAFKDWRDGLYTIETAEGAITLPERGAAPAAAEAQAEAQVAAAPADAPAPAPAPSDQDAAAGETEAWMRSPDLVRGEDRFRAQVAGAETRFDNRDASAEIDTARAALEDAGSLFVDAPAAPALRRPAPPGDDDPTLVRRQSDAAAGAPLLPEAPRADAPADLSGARDLARDAPARALAQTHLPPESGPAALDEAAGGPPEVLAQAPGEDPVRGLLRDLIEGDLPPPAAPAAPSGARAAPAVGVAPPAVGVAPPALTSAADVAPLGLELSAIVEAPRGVGAAAARLRDPELDYREGVLGARHAQPQFARSCARLARMMAPPLLASARAAPQREDPAALRVGFAGEVSDRTVAALAEAFYADSGVQAAQAQAPRGAATLVAAPAPRLIRPERVIGQRFNRTDEAEAAVAAGAVDLALAPPSVRALAPSAETRLIGFDAAALVAHPSNPTKSLSERDLHALLSGAATDWSMIDPAKVGAPKLYLPPSGSPVLTSLSQLVKVRRVNVRNAIYEPDPARRIAAALADPNGLAVVSRSALGEAKALEIGRPGSSAAPSIDTLRSGAYPLAIPLYVHAPEAAPHPAAALFADFLSRPRGQRAIYEAGLMPVAACDPTSCTLTAPGIEAARAALAPEASPPALEILPESAVIAPGPALAEIGFPAGASPTPDETVAQVLAAIKSLAARPETDRYLLVARAGVVGRQASPARRRQAERRAESAALALRCAGLIAAAIAIDDSPISGAFDGPAPGAEITVEMTPFSR